jgi:anti-sigma factor RsiW
MTCRTFIEFLMEFLEGTLPEAQRATFEEHLAECPWCTDYLKMYRDTLTLEKAAFTDPSAAPPADAPEELVRAILAARAATDDKAKE